MATTPPPTRPRTNADLLGGPIYRYVRSRPQVDRDNYDVKLTWQRAPELDWGKFAMLDAEVVDNFNLGFDDGASATRGCTWARSATPGRSARPWSSTQRQHQQMNRR